MIKREVKLDDEQIEKQSREYLIQNLLIARDQDCEVVACIRDYEEHEQNSRGDTEVANPHEMEREDTIWTIYDDEEAEKNKVKKN